MSAAIEAQHHHGRVTVNDSGSDAAPAYSVFNARLGFERKLAGASVRAFVRGNNLAGRRYAGSVIVGDTNGRYFEPAPGRNWFFGRAPNWVLNSAGAVSHLSGPRPFAGSGGRRLTGWRSPRASAHPPP